MDIGVINNIAIGLLLDVLVIAYLAYGFKVGYRRGALIMASPMLSFVISIVITNPIATKLYKVFGAEIELKAQSIIWERDYKNIYLILLQEIANASFVKRAIEVLFFLLSYSLLSALISMTLRRIKFSLNSGFINYFDRSLGGLLGMCSNIIVVFLLLSALWVLMVFEILPSNNAINLVVSSSFVTNLLRKINPLVNLLLM